MSLMTSLEENDENLVVLAPPAVTMANMTSLQENEMLLSGLASISPWSNDIPSMNEKRSEHAAVAIDKFRFMVIGGRDEGYKCLDSVEIFNTKTQEFYSGPSLNLARYNHSAACVENRIYVFGGYNYDNGGRLDSIECLDLSVANSKWKLLKTKLTCKRHGCTAAVVGHLIYIIGGWGESSVDIFDTRTDTIREGPMMKTKRSGSVAAVVGTTIFVFGGSSGFRTTDYLDIIECLNVASTNAKWKLCQGNLSEPKWFMGLVVLGNGCIIIVGGSNGNNHLLTAEMYDPNRDVCFKLPNMTTPRWGPAAVALDNTVYVMGGFNSQDKHLDSIEFMKVNCKETAKELKTQGDALYQKGRYHEALQKYKEALNMNPSSADCWSNLAACHEKLGQYEKMVKASTKCLELDGTFVRGYYRLASAQKVLGNSDASLATIEAGLAIDPDNERLTSMKKNAELTTHTLGNETNENLGTSTTFQRKTKREFETRAALDYEIRQIQAKIAAFADSYDPEAFLLQERIDELLAMCKKDNYASVSQLREQIASKKCEIDEKRSAREKIPLAQELKQLKLRCRQEEKAAIALREPEEIQESSNSLWKSWSANSPTPCPELSLSHLKLCSNGFARDRKLGGGGFSDVYLGIDTNCSLQFAIKKHHEKHMVGRMGESARKQLIREVEILSTFDHDNIVRILGYCFPHDELGYQCLVYEYAPGGSLATLMSNPTSKKELDAHDRIHVASCIASALNYLDKKNCSHRDVKPDNICFTEDLSRPLLIDFGMAKLVDDVNYSQSLTSNHGWSEPYVDPEYRYGRTKYDQQCEVYSFGFVLQVLITGLMPRPEDKPFLNYVMVRLADRDAGLWDSKALKICSDLAAECTQSRKPRSPRPNFDYILDKLGEARALVAESATAEQESLITYSIQNSSYRHGWKDVSRQSGKCFCGRETEAGLVCNRQSQPHFLCNTCFASHVSKHLGDSDIKCRDSTCIAHPFTESQLVKHLEPELLANHLAAVNKQRQTAEEQRRREEQMRRLEGIRHGKVMDALNSAARAREMMVEGETTCPLLYVLSKTRDVAGSGRLRKWKRKVKKAIRLKRTYVLHFVCAHSRTRISHGIVVEKTKDWLKKVAPALKVSLFLLGLAANVYGIQSPIPEGVIDEQVLDNLSEELANRLRQLENDMSRCCGDERSMTQMLSRAYEVHHEAYDEIAEMAKHDPKWRNEMKWSEGSSGGAWVKKDNYEAWKRALEV